MAASEREREKTERNRSKKKRRRLDESGRLVRAVKSIGLSAAKRDPRLLLDYYLLPPGIKKKGKNVYPGINFPTPTYVHSHERLFSSRCFIPIISCQRDSRSTISPSILFDIP